jgi:hypothetical protein
VTDQLPQPPLHQFEVGDQVITPSKAIARVVRVFADGVVLIEWIATGETANMRAKLLTPIPQREEGGDAQGR